MVLSCTASEERSKLRVVPDRVSLIDGSGTWARLTVIEPRRPGSLAQADRRSAPDVPSRWSPDGLAGRARLRSDTPRRACHECRGPSSAALRLRPRPRCVPFGQPSPRYEQRGGASALAPAQRPRIQSAQLMSPHAQPEASRVAEPLPASLDG